jgi:hypothetical protein
MARKSTKKARKAPTAASTEINESALTKGELRKLTALRKSLGPKIANQAFSRWIKLSVKSGPAVARDKNADLIADTLGKLIESSGLRIPRGGYVVNRGRGRVIVTPGKK